MNRVRFTFVADRYNRTALASLLAALEDVVEDPHACLRVVESGDAAAVKFEPSDGLSEVVCLSAMSVSVTTLVEAHRKLRERWGRAFVSVCGGAHASGDPRSLLEAGIDYCCVGEGEGVIRGMYHRLAEGESLGAQEGLYRLERGVVKGTRMPDCVEIEHFRPLPLKVPFATYIEVGRGCRWGCSYCQTPRIHGSKERYRSPAGVAETVGIYAAFGMKDFRFLLPNALGYMSTTPGVPNTGALEELLTRSKEACGDGRLFMGSFPSEIRPEYVTEEALRVLRASVSNAGLVIGGQSGSQKMLDILHRGHSVDDIKRACDVSLRCGFEISVDFVLGFPEETPEDRAATLDLVEEIGAHGVVSNMHFFMPLPGTLLASAQPVFLNDDERRRLDTFGQRGILRGRWRRQEQTARTWKEKR
jgi:B12-binding domain/radical SAM domain protein